MTREDPGGPRWTQVGPRQDPGGTQKVGTGRTQVDPGMTQKVGTDFTNSILKGLSLVFRYWPFLIGIKTS